jgi:GNAT superfamily N-acetyltransferase
MPVLEFRDGSAVEKRQPVKVGKRVCDFVVMPIDLANPVHRPDLRIPASRKTTISACVPVAARRGLMNDIGMKVRDAIPEDAAAACLVMRRSIAELCAADHGNDPAIPDRWLSNKTPEIFRSWIKPGNTLLVAVDNDCILAVGSVTDAGEITLNYVSPDARFRGVSDALLAALEDRARQRGNARCTLSSTETARRFYLARGYSENGPADRKFGATSGYPTSKRLVVHES